MYNACALFLSFCRYIKACIYVLCSDSSPVITVSRLCFQQIMKQDELLMDTFNLNDLTEHFPSVFLTAVLFNPFFKVCLLMPTWDSQVPLMKEKYSFSIIYWWASWEDPSLECVPLRRKHHQAGFGGGMCHCLHLTPSGGDWLGVWLWTVICGWDRGIPKKGFDYFLDRSSDQGVSFLLAIKKSWSF